ncbi:MAG: hypothetical protein A2073_05360 [Deltaproteobacteria bacterium GWC2_42_11]|nr:MAG: hypothetical protein A2073_05360 [Deltaproteobacteria bacterium GWC2_42_11]HBO84964.1 fimbrial protein [Deltaproteobacteria bacterium]
MIKINLLPVRIARKKESMRQQLSVAGLSLILLALIIGVVNYYESREIEKLNNTAADKEKELTALKAQTGELTKVREENKVIKGKLDIVRQLEDNKAGPVKLLEEIARAIPEKTWVNKLADSDTTISIAGNALSDEEISQFMRNLEKMAGIRKVELDVVEMTEKSGIKIKSFSIKMEKVHQASPKA